MIDHVSIPVRDIARAAAFYREVLAPLGLAQLVERPSMIGFGKRYPELWLNSRPELVAQLNAGRHVAIRARSPAAVEEFHSIAMRLGAADEGAPGPREAAMTSYFGAFIIDPDGNKIEALTFPE